MAEGPEVIFVGRRGSLILSWTDGAGEIFVISWFAHVVLLWRSRSMMQACWDYMQGNPSLSITSHAEWHHTLWSRRKNGGVTVARAARLGVEVFRTEKSSERRRSEGGREQHRLGKRALMFLEGLKTWEESSNVPWRIERCGTHVAILDGSDFNYYRCPRSFDCRSLLMGSQKSGVSRRPFNALDACRETRIWIINVNFQDLISGCTTGWISLCLYKFRRHNDWWGRASCFCGNSWSFTSSVDWKSWDMDRLFRDWNFELVLIQLLFHL